MLQNLPAQLERTRRWTDTIPVQLPPAFYRIANLIQDFLDKLGKDVDPDDLIYLRKCFDLDECPRIDYERYAVAFAHAYFMENFLKAACTFVVEQPRPVHRVLDAGCGSGAKILAYLVSLNERFHFNTSWTIHVVLLDSSPKQLRLAQNILSYVESELKHLKILLDIEPPEELRTWQPVEGSTDTLLLGHVLNENRHFTSVLLEKAATAVVGNGKIYILERPKDDVWVEIDKAVTKLALSGTYGCVELELRNTDKKQFSQLAQKTHITTGYLALSFPRRKQLMLLVRRYFQAWNEQSVGLLQDVFDQDAEYYDKPFKPPIRGLEGIKRYWEEHVLTQHVINLRVFDISYKPNEAFVEWEAEFLRFGQQVHLKGVLILRVRPGEDRVIELREYYRSYKR